MTKPDDILIDNATDYDPPRDINNAIEFAEQGWTFRSGTAAARGALPSAEKFDGLVWADKDSGRGIYEYDGTVWIQLARVVGTRKWLIPRVGGDGSFGSGSFVGVVSGVITGAPAGQYLLGFNGSFSGSVASTAYARFMANSTNVSNDIRNDLTTQALPPSGFTAPYTHGGGDLTLSLALQAVSGTATVYAPSSIWAVYVGP